MKKLIKSSGCLILYLTLLCSTSLKAQDYYSVYNYLNVPPENMSEMMSRIDNYWIKVAEAATQDNLIFFGVMTKMDGFDLPNSSNMLIIATYKDLDLIQETWDPSAAHPGVSMDKMDVMSLCKPIHTIYVKPEYWVDMAGANPEEDYNYIKMVYHKTSTPEDLIALENEHWAPFIKNAMDNGKIKQKAWGSARIVAPVDPNMPANVITFDLYKSMNDVMEPGWSEDLELPQEGLDKIMALEEENSRIIYTYKIQRIVQAPQPN